MTDDKNGMCSLSDEDLSYHSCNNSRSTCKCYHPERNFIGKIGIRAMTDEELVNWLCDTITDLLELTYPWQLHAPECDISCVGTTKTCRECWLNWMQKEA